jgi:coenzyme F420 hydrogenase subunit beta
LSLRKQVRDKLWHKVWTPEDLDKYIGDDVRGCYFSYAADEHLRARAASGGSTSALLVHMLESGQIDGALVCRTVVTEGKARPEFFVAQTREDIIAAQGSKYAAVYFASSALPLIQAASGRIAVVALPCDARILQQYRARNPDVDRKIACVITLFCGHNSEPALVDHVTARLGREHGPLVDYAFRYGHWRGKLQASYADGTAIEKPFSYFSDYRNLYFFAQPKCHHCFDHYGYHCDISAGDIWSPEMKADPIKHTALLTRTSQGEQIVHAAVEAGALIAREEPLVKVANGQARTMPFHYNVTSRARVGRLFGVKIQDHTYQKVRWNDYLIAFLALLNERVSRRAWGRRLILALPRPVVQLYLVFFKALESF